MALNEIPFAVDGGDGWGDSQVNDTSSAEQEEYQYDSDQAAFYQSERGAGVGPTIGSAWYATQDRIFSQNNGGDGWGSMLSGLALAAATIAKNSTNFAKGQGHLNPPQSNMVPIALLVLGGVLLATIIVKHK